LNTNWPNLKPVFKLLTYSNKKEQTDELNWFGSALYIHIGLPCFRLNLLGSFDMSNFQESSSCLNYIAKYKTR
ncbi:10111_t:CDS:2, partial [Gigaspora rosea]